MAETYRHGIYVNELATRLTPMITVATPTVAIGTAPIYMASDPAPVNEPVLCSSLSEFVRFFGFSTDFNSYTLCEAAQVFFTLFNVSPLICINVLDTAKHCKDGTKEIKGVANEIELTEPIILSTLKITSGNGVLLADDFTVRREDSTLIIKVTNQSKVVDDTLNLQYREVDASKVTAAEIIGGVDAATGKKKGLESIEDVYPKLGLIPGTIIAPKYSTDSAVAAAMKAKCLNINGCFRTICAVDLDTQAAVKYQDCNELKNQNNLVDANMIVCWPKVGLGGVQYHLSTQVAALMNLVDSQNDDIPFESPSNKSLQTDGALLKDGTEIFVNKAEANYLNGIGIVTDINFGGHRAWGNRTSLYPSSSDVKDSFIPVRRVFTWLGNTLITSYFSQIDNPMNRLLIESILDKANTFLAGLTSRGVILGGQVYFLAEDNSTTDLMDGIMRFHVYVTPPSPARVIDFVLEYQPDYLSNLFA